MATPEQCEVLQQLVYEHPLVVEALTDGHDLWVCPREGQITVWPVHNDATKHDFDRDGREHWDERLADIEMQPEVFVKVWDHLTWLEKNQDSVLTTSTVSPEEAARWAKDIDTKNKKAYEFLKARFESSS